MSKSKSDKLDAKLGKMVDKIEQMPLGPTREELWELVDTAMEYQKALIVEKLDA